MAAVFCSLINNEHQEIPPGGYHILRFPFGGFESWDNWQMHPAEQPDGHVVSSWADDPRSGLIWPRHPSTWGKALGTLEANIHWASGDYTELRDRFVRDPLALAQAPDSTATDHRPPSPGMQCFTKFHQIMAWPTVPLGLLVGHTSNQPETVVHAQFKLSLVELVDPC